MQAFTSGTIFQWTIRMNICITTVETVSERTTETTVTVAARPLLLVTTNAITIGPNTIPFYIVETKIENHLKIIQHDAKLTLTPI